MEYETVAVLFVARTGVAKSDVRAFSRKTGAGVTTFTCAQVYGKAKESLVATFGLPLRHEGMSQSDSLSD